MNPTVAWPLEVVRLRETVPPKAQAEMNSFTEAKRKCEFNLDVIFEDVTMTVFFFTSKDHLVSFKSISIVSSHSHIMKVTVTCT